MAEAVVQRPNRRGANAVVSSIALALAGAWCVALLIGAVTLPVYSTVSVSDAGVRSASATLVDVNGVRVLGVVALPVVPVAIVALALWSRRRAQRRGAGPMAWGAVGVLGAFACVAAFSIGLFVVPVVWLLAIACAVTYTAP